MKSHSELLETICQNIPDAICMIDREWNIWSWNRGAEIMFGYSAQEILGKSMATIIPPEIARQEIEHCVGELNRAGIMTAYRTVRMTKQGNIVPIELTAVALMEDGEVTGYASVMRDISDRKRLEDELIESESNIRAIFNSTRDAIIIHDLNGKILDVNNRMLELYGITEQEALRSSLQADLSAPGNPEATAIWERVMAGESTIFEWKARRPHDNSTFDAEVFLRRIVLKRSEVILAVVRDITEQKRAEQALRLTQFSIDRSSVSVFLVSPAARILYVNEQACHTLGYSRQELEALTVHDLDPNFPVSRWPAHWSELKHKGSLRFETLHRKKDGTVFPIDISVNYLSFGGREYNWAFANDITERKRTQEELGRAYAELEIKVRERTRELAAANAELTAEITERRHAVELIRKTQELNDAYNRISMTIHSTLDFNEIMQRVVKESVEALSVEAGMIGLFDDGEFRVRYTYNLPREFSQIVMTIQELRALRHAIEVKDAVAFPDAMTDGRLNLDFVRRMGIRSVLVTPVLIKDRVAGAIAFYGLSRKIAFSDEHVDFARKLKVTVSLALENARLYEALETSRNLAESRFAELQQIYETAPVGLCFLDRNLRYVSINRRLAEINETPIEDTVGRSIGDIIKKEPEARGAIESICRKVLETGLPVENVEIVRKKKVQLIVSSNFYPVRDRAGAVVGLNIVVQDITKRKRAEEALRRSEGLLSALLNSIPDMAWLKDREGRFILVNEPFAQSVGYRVPELTGKSDYDAWPRELAERYRGDDRDVMQAKTTKRFEEPVAVKQGPHRWIETIKTPIVNEQGNVVGTAGIARDITDRKRMEEEIRHMALHDPLTGLPNRRLFLDILNLEMAQARRHRSKLGILFLDLDRFKEINDTLGHDLGDRLLRHVAGRFRSTIRQSDTVARIGGDEFNMVLADVARAADVSEIAQKVVHSLAKPVLLGGHELHITTSVGISIYPDDSEEIESLLRYADIAMYHAKEQGRNRFQFYNPSINVSSLERMKLANYLRQAVKRNELSVLFQPQVEIRSGRIRHAEALVRWSHPERGLLDPKEFIPLAEETGYITTIDEWMLHTVCAQAAAWKKSGLPSFCVTVNLSARGFQNPDLVPTISAILRDTGMPPDCLDLEVTESTAMSSVERSASQLGELRNMGIHISIDDFGTGYSSLNYLKKLPIERLKIDQSFVRDIERDADDRAIISAVTSMAHKMGIMTVAEGVETPEQLAFLREAECDEAQGFLFSPPVPEDRFRELVTRQG